MTAYYVLLAAILFITAVLGFVRGKKFIKNDPRYLWVIFALLFIFAAVRSPSVCVDHYWYSQIFNSAKTKTFIELAINNGGIEIGYSYLNRIIALLGGNLSAVMIIVSAVYLFAYYFLIKTYSKNFALSLLIFVCYEYYIFSFGILRQAIVVALAILAIQATLDKKPGRFVALLLAGALFHKTALLLLPIYLLSYIKIDKKIVAAWGLLTAICAVFSKQIVAFVAENIYSPGPYLLESKNTGGYVCLLLLIAVSVYSLVATKLKDDDVNKMRSLSIKMIMFAASIQALATFYGTLHRVVLYYMIVLIPLVPNEIEAIQNKKQRMPLKCLSTFALSAFYIHSLVAKNSNYVTYALSEDWLKILITITIATICIVILGKKQTAQMREHNHNGLTCYNKVTPGSKFMKNLKDFCLTAISYLNMKGLIRVPDKAWLKFIFRQQVGYPLNLDQPQTFNEKLQWLKLYDRNPEYINMVDKCEAKRYVAERIGDKYVIPLLGVYDKFDDIDFATLPNQFVIKCTHDCGGLVICKDKTKLDLKSARKKINRSLKRNYYWHTREWPYKNIRPRIIIEQFVEDAKTAELRDYKFFCFNGEPKIMFVATARQTNKEPYFDFYDMDFKHLNIKQGHPNAKTLPEKPAHFEKMKELAAKLSQGIPHIRVDFYEANGRIYFGELTLYHFGGIVPFRPEEWDKKLGDWLILPEQKGKR